MFAKLFGIVDLPPLPPLTGSGGGGGGPFPGGPGSFFRRLFKLFF